METYKKYSLILDSADEDDQKLIKYLEDKHGKKRKNSYSAILKGAVKMMMKQEENSKTDT